MLGRRVRGLRRRVCGLPHARVLLRRAAGLRERVHVMAGVLNPQRLMWLLGRLVRPVSPLWRINNLEACTPRCNLNWAPQAGEWHPHMTSATCTTPSHMRTLRHKARVQPAPSSQCCRQGTSACSVQDTPHGAATFILPVLPILSLQGCKVIPAGGPLACGSWAPQHSLGWNSNARLMGVAQQGAVHLSRVLEQGLQLGTSLAILSLELHSHSTKSSQVSALRPGIYWRLA